MSPSKLSVLLLALTACTPKRLSLGRDGDASVTGPSTCTSAKDVAALAPRSWCRVPGSHLRDVAASPVPEGNSGIAAVIEAWSGGAYDAARERLLVFGGGRFDYSGNEVYAFSLESLTWSRITEPSTDVSGDPASGVYPDGRPRARESFNHLVYLPAPEDALCALNAASRYGETGLGGRDVQCLDLASGTWTRGMDAPLVAGVGGFAAADPSSGLAYFVGGMDVGLAPHLARYDASANAWSVHAALSDAWQWLSRTAAVDDTRHRMVAVGEGMVGVFDLGTPDVPPIELATTGGDVLVDAPGIGLEYESIADRFVAWNGGADVYALDVDTATWSRTRPSNDVVPSAAAINGTYGRFRYSRALNVFVVVSSVDEDVYLYRLSAR